MIKHTILKNYFGYHRFRAGQEEIIDALLSGKDVLGIMPTGSGKSLCYQVPAICMPGITIVVSPLISLMHNQVEALTKSGVPSAYINSSLSPSQLHKVIDDTAKGKYKIIYVSPERLDTSSFMKFARKAEISMVAIDEAHCISQWGQDFRPGYLKISKFLNLLKSRPVIAAFTATATKQVQIDICKALEMKSPLINPTGFNRPNLYFEVLHPKKKYDTLLQLIKTHEDRPGIIYCATKRTTDQVYNKLIQDGVKATKYHAGLENEQRAKNQSDFLNDRASVIVATNAFGMGIDKSNVGFVIHYNMPKDLESYYQEAGRAGRDGSPAYCAVLYSPGDVRTNQALITKGSSSGSEIEERALDRLKLMTFYCHTKRCLRGYILDYFGDKKENSCGNCGNCKQKLTVTF